jgi:hypothetical protein
MAWHRFHSDSEWTLVVVEAVAESGSMKAARDEQRAAFTRTGTNAKSQARIE